MNKVTTVGKLINLLGLSLFMLTPYPRQAKAEVTQICPAPFVYHQGLDTCILKIDQPMRDPVTGQFHTEEVITDYPLLGDVA